MKPNFFCDITGGSPQLAKSRLGHGLPTSVNDSDFKISRNFAFHNNKTIAKILEFTV